MRTGDDPEDCPPAPVPDGALFRDLVITNKKGLHARASAKFVQTVERFDADVTVTRCGETVGGRSIMGLLTLGAAQGTTITVTAEGEDAGGDVDVFAAGFLRVQDGVGEGFLIADAGQLDEHRQIDAGDDFHRAAVHA